MTNSHQAKYDINPPLYCPAEQRPVWVFYTLVRETALDYAELLKHLRWQADELAPGTVVTARVIYGAELWDELSKSVRLALGRIMVSLVAAGLLQLEHIGRTSQNHQLYQRI
jgi:hypothetical protein